MSNIVDAYIELSDDADTRRAFIGDNTFSPLALAVDSLAQVAGIKRILLPADRVQDGIDQIQALKPYLDDERVRVMPRITDPDLDAREVGRRLRQWSVTGNLHGPLMTTEFCTYGNPGRVLKSLPRPFPGWVLMISGNHGFITEQIIRSLFDQANKSEWNERFFCADGPRGLVPWMAKREVIEEHFSENIILQNEWRSRVVFWGKPIAHVPPSVVSCPRNFTLENPRARAFTHATAAVLLEQGKSLDASLTMEDVTQATAGLDDLWIGDLPRDIEVEITTKRPFDPEYMPKLTRKQCDMSLQDFTKIVEQLTEDFGNINLTLGGHGDPAEHPDLVEFVRVAKKHCAGVCVRTFAVALKPETYEQLVEAQLDVLNVRFGYWDQEAYKEAHGLDIYEEVRTKLIHFLRGNLEERESLFPVIVPEVVKGPAADKGLVDFYEKWGERLAWPTISNYKTWGGALEAKQPIEMFPGTRRPCDRTTLQLKIYADGSVPLCAVDFDAKRPIGNAFTTPIKELWRSPMLEALRKSHREGAYERENPACKGCLEWFRLD